MDKLLAILGAKSLHVHQMPESGAAEIYQALDSSLMQCPSHTHYVMCGEYVLHIGTAKTTERFAYSFDPHQGWVDDYPFEVFDPNG
tara:strand:+ start:168 stop:425 length:258 start_codon:yes stop_codon:yes gene_type:complete